MTTSVDICIIGWSQRLCEFFTSGESPHLNIVIDITFTDLMYGRS